MLFILMSRTIPNVYNGAKFSGPKIFLRMCPIVCNIYLLNKDSAYVMKGSNENPNPWNIW